MIPFYSPELEKGTFLRIIKGLFKGDIYNGAEIERFEKDFAKYINTKYAITFASGRYALYLAYKFFGCDKKRIVLPSYTCIPAIDASRWACAEPYFLDIDLSYYNPRFNSSLNRLSNIGAVSLSYLYGLIGDIKPFLKFAKEKEIPLIEDSAIALGAMYNNKKAGSLGDAAVFSLQSSKIITAWKGGVITTNNKELYGWLKEERKKQINPPTLKLIFNCYITYLRKICSNRLLYKCTMKPLKDMASSRYIGGLTEKLIDQNPIEAINGKSPKKMPASEKFRFTNLQALLALPSFEKIDKIIKRRREMAKILAEELKSKPNIKFPSERKGAKNAYGRFPVRIEGENKYDIQKKLSMKGIEVSLNYPYIIPQTQYMKKYNLDKKMYPNAVKASKETFILPFHTGLKNEEIAYMAKSIKEIA
ncbi:DegT/DnrJ/EryC1/StrS family aminotransferase [Candidatus Woesearchaeota archaeon]|nr:DegT/DnrJ/EryC1/StrS family aminotransferase [Candidatus Woesearchaeota archaeon]